MNVVWTDLALSSLRETNQFILDTWNQKISNDFLEAIDSNIDQISINPNIGQNIPNTTYKRILIHKHISLFYQTGNQEIKLLLVWDNRQSPKKLSKNLKLLPKRK